MPRIAIVFPGPWNTALWQKDPGLMAAGLLEQGADVTVAADFWPGADEPGGEIATLPIDAATPDVDAIARVAPDGALVYTWLSQIGLLGSLREAGIPTIAKGDSDALVSPRRHPVVQMQRMLEDLRFGRAWVKTGLHG